MSHAGRLPGIELKFCPLCGKVIQEHADYTSIVCVDRKYECVPCGILFYSHRWDNRLLWYPTASESRPWFDPMCSSKSITNKEREAIGGAR